MLVPTSVSVHLASGGVFTRVTAAAILCRHTASMLEGRSAKTSRTPGRCSQESAGEGKGLFFFFVKDGYQA